MDEHAPEFVPSGADGGQGLLYAGSVCHLVQMSDMACCEQVSAIWCRWLTMILEDCMSIWCRWINMHLSAGLCHLVQMDVKAYCMLVLFAIWCR